MYMSAAPTANVHTMLSDRRFGSSCSPQMSALDPPALTAPLPHMHVCHICMHLLQALIWDLSALGGAGGLGSNGPGGLGASAGSGVALDPILAYSAATPVNQLQWSSSQPDWVSIVFGNKAQILRV